MTNQELLDRVKSIRDESRKPRTNIYGYASQCYNVQDEIVEKLEELVLLEEANVSFR